MGLVGVGVLAVVLGGHLPVGVCNLHLCVAQGCVDPMGFQCLAVEVNSPEIGAGVHAAAHNRRRVFVRAV